MWGEEKACNISTSWIGNAEKENEKVNEQKWENITVLGLKAALTKSQKWKSPGVNKVPKFLVKCAFMVHCCIFKFTEWNYAKPGKKLLNGCATEQYTC